MTISDLVKRLQNYLDGKGYTFKVPSDTQVKLGKDINNQTETFDYFDIVRVDKDIVLVPTDKWDRRNREK
jgi:hypothetical protein